MTVAVMMLSAAAISNGRNMEVTGREQQSEATAHEGLLVKLPKLKQPGRGSGHVTS